MVAGHSALTFIVFEGVTLYSRSRAVKDRVEPTVLI